MSVLSKVTGADAEHNANIAQTNATEQYQRQKGYQNSGSGIYGQLGSQGAGQYADYHNNYMNLLSQFGNLSGLGNTISQFGGPGQPAYGGTSGALGGQPGGWHMAQPINQAAIDAAGGPSVIAQYNHGPSPQATTQNTDPYALDQYQQQQLNQSNANIARQATSAVSAFTQRLNAQGITDPRALQVGTEQIHEHFADIAAKTQTDFYEQAKKDKLASLQSIIGELGQYGQQGIGQQEAAGSGYLGLTSGANAANAQQQATALQQHDNSLSQLSGLANFAATAAGYGVPAAPKATGSYGYPGTNPVPAGPQYGPIAPGDAQTIAQGLYGLKF